MPRSFQSISVRFKFIKIENKPIKMKADMFLCMGKCNTALSIEHEIIVHVNQRETHFLICCMWKHQVEELFKTFCLIAPVSQVNIFRRISVHCKISRLVLGLQKNLFFYKMKMLQCSIRDSSVSSFAFCIFHGCHGIAFQNADLVFQGFNSCKYFTALNEIKMIKV